MNKEVFMNDRRDNRSVIIIGSLIIELINDINYIQFKV